MNTQVCSNPAVSIGIHAIWNYSIRDEKVPHADSATGYFLVHQYKADLKHYVLYTVPNEEMLHNLICQ